jgi:hypothetical protein
VLCGRWETYPREFAKCRRCRKAKYCGKECQSTAWSEGHRFWCSAKDGDDDADPPEQQPTSADTVPSGTAVPVTGGGGGGALAVTTGGTVTGRAERRTGGHVRERALATVSATAEAEAMQAARSAALISRPAGNTSAHSPPPAPHENPTTANDPLAMFAGPPPPHVLANRAAAAARQASLIRNLQAQNRPARNAETDIDLDYPPRHPGMQYYRNTMTTTTPDRTSRGRTENNSTATATSTKTTMTAPTTEAGTSSVDTSGVAEGEAGPSTVRGRRRLGTQDDKSVQEMVIE